MYICHIVIDRNVETPTYIIRREVLSIAEYFYNLFLL